MTRQQPHQQTLDEYALPEVRIRLEEGTKLYSQVPMSGPDEAARVMAGMLSQMDREYFCVVNCDAQLRAINYNVVAVGGIRECPVPVPNVFKSAILSNAASIILLHNHPSGNLTPSDEDLEVTKKLCMAGADLDIPIVDHLIVGGGDPWNYYSMQSEGDLDVIRQSIKCLAEKLPLYDAGKLSMHM